MSQETIGGMKVLKARWISQKEGEGKLLQVLLVWFIRFGFELRGKDRIPAAE
jgi:hypothetical protein